MKPAKYETSTGALSAFLASKPQAAFLCDLYTITFAGNINGGAPLYFTTADVDVVVPYGSGTITYSSKLIYLDQLTNKAYGHWKVGLDVDTWQVIAAPSPQAMIGNQPFLQALRAGALDGATIEIDRAFIDTRTTPIQGGLKSISPLGVLNIFTGRSAEVDFGRTNAVLTINSHLELLNVNMPRNLFQAGCRWKLYQPGCNLNRADFVQAGSLAAASSSKTLSVTVGSPTGSGTFSLGQIIMTSGANNGFARMIRSWTPGSPAAFTLLSAFPFPLAIGDTFNAYPGCDRQENTCINFGNLANFGGMPFIPAPETAT